MKGLGRILATAALVLLLVAAAAADSLELKDGRVLQGRYLGGTQAVLRFEANGEVQTFNVTEVVALTFTGNRGTPAPTAAVSVPQSAAAPAAAGTTGTIPAGQPLLGRTIDREDSSNNHLGAMFHAL